MSGYDRLMERLSSGERILIDGATGTEIERRGVPLLDDAWSGGGALSHPDILRAVHQDYIREGAEIIISNTFATHRHALCDAGVEDLFEALNRRGVELAVEARELEGNPNILVAGGLSYWAWSGNWRDPQSLRAGAEEQASIMAAAGADLMMLEMMVDIEAMLVCLDAAQASGLPVWVGMSCRPDENGVMSLWRGGTLAEAFAVLQDRNVPLASIMHTQVEFIDGCLDIARDHWAGPIGVYAHSARWENHVCYYDQTISPEDYASQARGWMEQGAQLIGGCCGLGVDHIRALSPLVRSN